MEAEAREELMGRGAGVESPDIIPGRKSTAESMKGGAIVETMQTEPGANDRDEVDSDGDPGKAEKQKSPGYTEGVSCG